MLSKLLPDNWIGYRVSRVLCRTFGQHTVFCRGRQDHRPDTGRWS